MGPPLTIQALFALFLLRTHKLQVYREISKQAGSLPPRSVSLCSQSLPKLSHSDPRQLSIKRPLSLCHAYTKRVKLIAKPILYIFNV